MAERMDVAHPADASVLDRLPLRTEDGEIRAEFVEEITRRIQAKDTQFLRAVVAELHEADLGDLIAALEPEDRVSLVEMTGTDFDFSALNEVDDAVREEILEELEPETVAEGVRELESDDAVELLEALDEDRRRGSVLDDQEEVARMFGKYNLVAAPVIDTQNRLVGIITIDDVVDVIEEEADEDLKALGGVTSDEQLSDNVWTIARGRFNWLLVNLATAFLASSVLGLFEGQLEKMVALAVLAPIVASQGGNAATQTMTVAVRALATRELGANNAFRVVIRESLVGLVNGIAFAVITGIAAVAWFKIPGLGVVIGLAIICNLVAGALGGILIPMVLERVRADPAVASGTFVTTITDVVGFFSFLGIATLWFGLKG